MTDLKRSQDRNVATNFIFSSDNASASPAPAMSSGLMPLLSRNSCRAVNKNTRVRNTKHFIEAHARHTIDAAEQVNAHHAAGNWHTCSASTSKFDTI